MSVSALKNGESDFLSPAPPIMAGQLVTLVTLVLSFQFKEKLFELQPSGKSDQPAGASDHLMTGNHDSELLLNRFIPNTAPETRIQSRQAKTIIV